MKTNNSNIFNYIIIILLLLMILWNFFGDKILPKQEKNNKIDSINYVLKNIELNQKKIDSILYDYNKKISSIDESIIKIKIDKNQLMKEYNEKINRVNNYNINQLDSFFTNRYK